RNRAGPRPTIIASLDPGISPTHPDLQDQLPGENFVTAGTDTSDDNGHGTFGAGQAAALTNNGQGITSPPWEGVLLLPVKILDAGGGGTLDAEIAGINFAVAQGADVINMSLGGPSGGGC